MREDRPPFNFDAFSTHQPHLSCYLRQPKKKKKEKSVMRNKVKTFQTSKGVCHIVALPFTLKSILRQMETQVFQHAKI
jgi:hypothetical protein